MIKRQVRVATEDRKSWDVVVLDGEGRWMGFRAPWATLQRTGLYLGFVVLGFSLAVTGWLFSRWQVAHLTQNLNEERLKTTALESRVHDLINVGSGPRVNEAEVVKSHSLLPSLDSDAMLTGDLDLKSLSADYESQAQELVLDFELERKKLVPNSPPLYWVALLHGPQGILAFPQILESGAGEILQVHKAEPLEGFRSSKTVRARYKIGDFAARSRFETLFVTLIIVDDKGTTVLKSRSPLNIKRFSG
jgi:hypothetical protein